MGEAHNSPVGQEGQETVGYGVPPKRMTCAIPDGLVDLPFSNDRARILRFESGLVLDPQLRKLARLSGAVDRMLALCLGRLQAGRGFVRLGRARFDDYTRERLNLPPRTARELARVGRALGRLPLLDEALRYGRIPWSSAAQVSRLAGLTLTKKDEAEWVKRASDLSVRELTASVRRELARAREGPRSVPGASAGPSAARFPDAASEGSDTNAGRRSETGNECAAPKRDPGDLGSREVSGPEDGPARGMGERSEERRDDAGEGRADASAQHSAEAGPRLPARDAARLDGPVESRDEGRDEEQAVDEDPLVRLSVATGGRTACLWGASLELCELVVGRPLAPGEGEEYILADFLSGTVPPPDGHEPCFPLGAPRVHPAARRRRRGAPGGDDPGGVGAGAADERGSAPELGDRVLSIDLTAEIAQALALVDGAVPDDPFAMDGVMRQLIAARSGIDVDLARLLRNFQSLGLARHLGFDNFGHYARERLGISVARARFLVTLDRRLCCSPAIVKAVRAGQIGAVAALLVARVARPGPSVKAWIDRARTRTVVRLREEVAWAERRSERLGWRHDDMPPPTGPLPSDLAELTVHLFGRAADAASQLLSQEPWIRITGDPALDDAAPDDAAPDDAAPADATPADATPGAQGVRPDPDAPSEPGDSNGCTGAPCEMSAGDSGAGLDDAVSGAPGGRPDPDPRSEEDDSNVDGGAPFEMSAGDPDTGPPVRVGFPLRESVVSSWTEARQRIGAVGGLQVVSDSRVLFEIASAFLRTYMPLWVEQVELGDPIAVRDRFRCQMPGCTLHRGAAHHLRFRSRGGSDHAWNLLFVCEVQHLDGIHALRSIRASGRAPDLLVVELGIRRDGTALETFVRRPSRRRVSGGHQREVWPRSMRGGEAAM